MITLKEYLEIDESKNRFELPISFWQKIWFTFLSKYLTNYKFTEKLFVDVGKSNKYYWEIIVKFLTEKLEADLVVFSNIFFNRFISYKALVFSNKGIPEEKKLYGFGVHSGDWEIAISKAIGEFLERYYFTVGSESDYSKIKTLNFLELKSKAKLISDFHDYSQAQKNKFSNLGFKSEEVEAIIVTELISNRKVFYPSQQIFRQISDYRTREGIISQNTSSGCAGGFSLEEATISAIYESVERDSFMCYYMTKSSPKKINSEDLENQIPLFGYLENFFKNMNFKIEIFDTTTDIGIFSCICKLTNLETGGFVISGAANLDPLKAFENALQELIAATEQFEKESGVELDDNYKPFITEGIDREKRLWFAVSGKNKKEFEFWDKGEVVPLKNILEQYLVSDFTNNPKGKLSELNFLLKIFKDTGKNYNHVYRFVSAEKILKDLGYFVVKVIIPKLYPLYLNEELALIESSRLKEFNLWKNVTEKFQVNSFPHPFP